MLSGIEVNGNKWRLCACDGIQQVQNAYFCEKIKKNSVIRDPCKHTNTWNQRRRESGFDKHIQMWMTRFQTRCSSIVYTARINFKNFKRDRTRERERGSENASKWTICISIFIIEINCVGSYSIRRNVWLVLQCVEWTESTTHCTLLHGEFRLAAEICDAPFVLCWVHATKGI